MTYDLGSQHMTIPTIVEKEQKTVQFGSDDYSLDWCITWSEIDRKSFGERRYDFYLDVVEEWLLFLLPHPSVHGTAIQVPLML